MLPPMTVTYGSRGARLTVELDYHRSGLCQSFSLGVGAGCPVSLQTDRQRMCLRKVDYRTRYHITGSAGEKEVQVVASHYTIRHLRPNDRHLALDQNRPHLRIDILILDNSNIYTLWSVYVL